MIIAIVIALFSLAFIGFGYSLFNGAESPKNTAKELQSEGLTGTVTGARVKIWNDTTGENRASEMELTFSGADGSSHTLTTTHFPAVSTTLTQKAGWYEDFSSKSEVLNQQVRYSLGEKPIVELESELPKLASAPWSFPNFLGIAFAGIGLIGLIGAVIGFFRSLSAG